jgi:putative membrane protein
MAADLALAILHHLLVFSIFAVIAAELVLVRPGLGAGGISRLADLDRAYGLLALLIIVVGAARVIWGAKGWEYYAGNPYFWAKMASFAAVGLLSIPPTMKIVAWRKASAAEAAYAVPDAEIAAIRRYIHLEAGMFLLIRSSRPSWPAAWATDRGFARRQRDQEFAGSGAVPIPTSGAGMALVLTSALQRSAITQRSHSGRRALQT